MIKMQKSFGILLAMGLIAGSVSAQSIIAPVGCELLNGQTEPDGPFMETIPPVGWWNSAGIITNESLIADGASVPAEWPQHEYGFSEAKAPRVRAVNADTTTPDGTAVLTFDMGGVVNVDGIVLWNHGEGDGNQSDRGVETVEISYSTDGINFTESGETLTFQKGPQDTDATTLTPIDAQQMDLTTALTQVTHVRLKCVNFTGSNTAVGFAEIRMIGERPFAPKFIDNPVVKQSIQYGSDYSLENQTLAGSASNSAGDEVSYVKVDGPEWLAVATNGVLSGVAGLTGVNEFSIKAFVGDEATVGTLQITVDPLGNAPVFTTNDFTKADAVFGEDYADKAQTLVGEATDPDAGDTLIYLKNGGPAWLNVASNGVLSGVCDVLGTNSFSVIVDDGNGNSDTAALRIFVPTIGEAPVFTVDPIVKTSGNFGRDYAIMQQTLAGSATDPDGDELTYSKTAGAAWLIVDPDGALSGVTTLAGTNSATVKVDDGKGNTATATLLVYIKPKPVGDLIVGVDTFDNNASPSVTYLVAQGVDASVSATGFVNSDSGGRGSSGDLSWGTHVGPPAASDVTSVPPANFTVQNGDIDGEITFTITNSGTEDLELGAFHFDALAFRPKASRTYALNVLEGSDITVGNVFTSADQAITSVGGNLSGDNDQHDDVDIDLTVIDDHVLQAGETAIIQVKFTGGTVGAGGHHLFIDNMGVSLAGVDDTPVPQPEMVTELTAEGLVISWESTGSFKVQTRSSLAFGDWVDYPGGVISPVTVSATNDVEFLRLIQQ